MSKRSNYEVELFYAWEESPYGTYHAFEAVGMDENADSDEMARELAAVLDCVSYSDEEGEIISDNFHCNSMFIALPQSVIDQIKADAIKEYLENSKN